MRAERYPSVRSLLSCARHDEAEESLSELVERSLLEWMNGKYSMHDFVRQELADLAGYTEWCVLLHASAAAA